ncbi:Aste57867_8870 [Aphanomyces stellatus]|uniref:Aste57867_8870 protein n=1 Tax=Aphanomyces stellatus TaxID=120398 RepID=A0A485KLJ0_9STRA|nr:hypothetical protein As57867_008835 [Aphanomyces stellatus]VFT85756.1 Aste57867_8870 [Aphanomyces stellatus]
MEAKREDSIQDLLKAIHAKHVDIVQAIVDRGHVDVNAVVRIRNGTGLRCMGTPLIFASEYGHVDSVAILLKHDGINVNFVDDAFELCLDHAKFGPLAVVLKYKPNGLSQISNKDGTVLVELCAQYLEHESAIKLLLADMPIQIQDEGLVPRHNHSLSWSSFMDVTHPVKFSGRQSCLESILNDPAFATYTRDLLRELAFAKDKHSREVIQITDQETRKYFYDRLYFCGRYEIFHGPPVYVSNTAMVVMAYDHGICGQVFHEHINSHGVLDVNDFFNCNKILGRVECRVENKKIKKLENEKWQEKFRLWDKDANGWLSEQEFLSYCEQYFGAKLQVAMKFMKNGEQYQREINNRAELDASFVLPLLPSVEQSVFNAKVKNLQIHGGHSIAEYPNVIVMPAADRSLEDIYLKERPGENERRILLQQVAEGLQHLHQNDLVYGDAKKVNAVRVGNRLNLIDLDATTTVGNYVGAKHSSGHLPPEMFYILKSDEEEAQFCQHWSNIKSTDPILWQKLKPKNGYVVKSFRSETDTLPYNLVKAHPSLDVWAFGALMYQMYSSEELVATDINQDVLEKEIEEAATWIQEDLNVCIREYGREFQKR